MKIMEEQKNKIMHEHKILQFELEEFEKKKKTRYMFVGILDLCMMILVTIGIGYSYYNTYGEIKKIPIVTSILIGGFVSILSILCLYIWNDIKESALRRNILQLELLGMQKKVEEDIFENSVKMSYKYLDEYYYQTREQAQRGFLVTICVAVFGAILVGTGIIAMFCGKTSPSYVTCASGVITEFIAAVFFYLYNKTVSRRSKYHNKLVLSQNISIGLKVADSLTDDEKVKAKQIIISELLKNVNSYIIKSDSGEKEDK